MKIVGGVVNSFVKGTIDSLLLKGSRNVAGDVGAGISSRMSSDRQKSIDSAMKQAEYMRNKGNFKGAQDTYANISKDARKVAKTFSPYAKNHPLQRGLTLGSEVATDADLISGLIKIGKARFAARKPEAQSGILMTQRELEATRLLRGGAKPEDLVKKGFTVGDIQKAAQRNKGLGLLADFDNASRAKNTELMKQIADAIDNMPPNSPYAQYKGQFKNIIGNNVDDVTKGSLYDIPIEKYDPIDVATEKMAVKLKKQYPDGITLYHQTSKDTASSISKNGFRSGEKVYFTALQPVEDRVMDSSGRIADGIVKIKILPEDYKAIFPDEYSFGGATKTETIKNLLDQGMQEADITIPRSIANRYIKSNVAQPPLGGISGSFNKGLQEGAVNAQKKWVEIMGRKK